MMIIEMREAKYDKMFEMLDQVMLYGKKLKMVLCALEDAMYECYEELKDEYDDYEDYEKNSDESEHDEDEMNYKRNYAMRRNMRHNEEDSDYGMRLYGHRSGMRSRRNRMGRFV